LRTVGVPKELEPIFEQAQRYVERYFEGLRFRPEQGTIDVSGQRYVLVRAGALSVEFFEVVRRLYGSEDTDEAMRVARDILFDTAHAMGLADAQVFAERTGVSDPVARLSAGPVHFAHAGWAFVEILPESRPSPDDRYCLVYDHPYSFESDAWLRVGKRTEMAVCVMNAGYSSGWCEASFGMPLLAAEIFCRARGDDYCRFIMAPPATLGRRIEEYLDAHPGMGKRAGKYDIPGFFARQKEAQELRVRTRSVERELGETQELNTRIMQALPAGLVHVRADGAIVDANAAACELLGMRRDELTGRLTRDFETQTIWEDGSVPTVAEYPVSRALASGLAQPPVTMGVRRPDGETTWALFSAVPVSDVESGHPSGAIVTILDITDRKREEEKRLSLETQFRETQRLESLGVLAGGIAHDFNNLLVGVLTNACHAQTLTPKGSELDQLLRQIVGAAESAAELTREMLAYAGKGAFRVEALDLGLVVRETSQILRVSISKDVSLRLDLPGGLPRVDADVAQLRQVVMNIILNAAEAIDGAGIVRVRVARGRAENHPEAFDIGKRPEGPVVSFEVEDTGCGMDEATRQRVFDPFFTTKFEGRGLGLASVGGIARTHGWAVRVRSVKGEGTKVTVLLPVSKQSLVHGLAPVPPVTRGLAGCRVLLIDDDERVRFTLELVLAKLGCEVQSVASGELGAQAFAQREFDVVLLDLTMPGLGGIETLARLRQLSPDVRVVLMSGYSVEEVRSRYADHAPTAFLSKPFTTDALESAITATLGAPSG
jgi:PAS domain S-box-containing protein